MWMFNRHQKVSNGNKNNIITVVIIYDKLFYNNC